MIGDAIAFTHPEYLWGGIALLLFIDLRIYRSISK